MKDINELCIEASSFGTPIERLMGLAQNGVGDNCIQKISKKLQV